MKNSCFLDNDFLRQAPVMTFGNPEVVVEGVYGTPDEDVECQFIAEFESGAGLEQLVNFTCVEYDADTCLAAAPETPPPKITPAPVQPTRVPRRTDSPSIAPVPEPTTAPEAGCWAVSASVWVFSAGFVAITFF
jgi:hypothetical protein